MTMKLFISYARVDKPLCKQIVSQLDAVHDVWYDRRLHAGMDWWAEIQAKLDWCEGFVYLMSPESVASEYCQKEFAIATEAGKHIFPVLIQARTKIPESLSHIHYANLSEGMEDIITLLNAITLAERRQRKPVPKPAPKVQQPNTPPKDMRPREAIPQAADAMDVDNFDSAVFILKGAIEKKPTGRIKRMLLSMLEEAETALEKQAYLREAEREYRPIAELVKRERTRNIGCEEFVDFQTQFPEYDPDDLQAICGKPAVTVTTSKVPDILPAPFAWVDIPTGQVTLITEEGWADNYIPQGGEKTFTVEAFAITKYPITNAQYRLFVNAGGYITQRWWTEAGWTARLKGWKIFKDTNQWMVRPTDQAWAEPRYWDDSDFNSDNQPIVGVSWHEANAYTQWLTEVLGELVMLPTEQQWQRAAQGDDNLTYPWGNQWDVARCQNTVDSKAGKTSSVTEYEGKGDSPFGVVDMAGNVWEWCLDHWHKTYTGASTDGSAWISSDDNALRLVRGGFWLD
ncbi:MAG: SUMF1/EgtB/PvdO family nonheme iron enzyme, partial [Chloroflexota bacterium]